jgi:hypothetical protein
MYTPASIYEACGDAGKHLLHARAALAAQREPVALTVASSAAGLHGFRPSCSCALDQVRTSSRASTVGEALSRVP